jgi:putative glutamine amidotransferase
LALLYPPRFAGSAATGGEYNASMRPLIGIPQCLDDRGRWRAGRTYQYLDYAYARAVDAAGGSPVFLAVQGDVGDLVARIDGLLLPGGGDFPPPRPYPESVRFERVPPEQLDFDRRLLEGARSRQIPILAICYGMQLLALHFGGTLLYDIETDAPDVANHRLPEPDGRHPVEITANSRLAEILGSTPGPVNSLHHQAVATPGDLLVAARSPDGLIEAIERPGADFCIGVQWHPEKLSGTHCADLMAAFVRAQRED